MNIEVAVAGVCATGGVAVVLATLVAAAAIGGATAGAGAAGTAHGVVAAATGSFEGVKEVSSWFQCCVLHETTEEFVRPECVGGTHVMRPASASSLCTIDSFSSRPSISSRLAETEILLSSSSNSAQRSSSSSLSAILRASEVQHCAHGTSSTWSASKGGLSRDMRRVRRAVGKDGADAARGVRGRAGRRGCPRTPSRFATPMGRLATEGSSATDLWTSEILGADWPVRGCCADSKVILAGGASDSRAHDGGHDQRALEYSSTYVVQAATKRPCS